MDIYNFIESEAIRAHCLEIGKDFNISESIQLIHSCIECSIQEKHNAYMEILNVKKDVKVKSKVCANESCISEFLKMYIKEQEIFLSLLDSKKYDCDITFHYISQKGSKRSRYTETFISKDYSKVIEEEIKKEKKNLQYIVLYCKDLKLRCLVNAKGKIIFIDHDKLNDMEQFFDELSLYIPTPFKKGDILFNKSIEVDNPKPFVLEKIDRNNGYWGYYLEDDLFTEEKLECEVLHLEYYTDDDSIEFQYLKALSLFVQDKISESHLAKIRELAKTRIKQDELLKALENNNDTKEIVCQLIKR